MKVNNVLTIVKEAVSQIPFRKTDEKVFKYDSIRLRYMLFKEDSNVMLVIFREVSEESETGYGSPEMLEGFRASRLYILNNDTPYGGYHLNVKEGVCEESAVSTLIRKTAKKCKAKKLIFIGIEKNGYSAVNFGIGFKNAVMITGAPDYFIGDNLSPDKNINWETASGKDSDKVDIRKFNYRLQNKILGNPYADTQCAYIHCSVNGNSFRKHVKPLESDLKESGTEVIFDRGWYEDKGELKEFFPGYLKRILKTLIQPKEVD